MTISRLQVLEDKQARQSAYVSDPEHYQFRVAVSCPPDLRVHMRGGLMYDIYDGDSWFIPSATIDLTGGVQVGNKDYTFTVAGNYLFYVLTLDCDTRPDPPLFLPYGPDTEYTTTAEAEQALAAYNNPSIWNVLYPLCGLILRNNGVLGTGLNILPIDRINRGRSYLWPADMRPRNIAL